MEEIYNQIFKTYVYKLLIIKLKHCRFFYITF